MAAKDTVRAFYQAVAAGDVTAMLAVLDEDVEWTEAAGFPYAGTYRGVQAVFDGVFSRVAAEWDRFDTDPGPQVAEGDEVITLGTYRGTHRATGRSFAARFAHAATVRDGRIVRFEQVVDTAEVNKAL